MVHRPSITFVGNSRVKSGSASLTGMSKQQDTREFIHCTHADGRICYVNDAWLVFAAENGWNISVSQVLGSMLMQQIADAETRHVYKLLIDSAAKRGRKVHFNFRCDSPDYRRLMEMSINYDRTLDLVEYRSRVIKLEEREPVKLMDTSIINRSGEALKVCGWCKAVWVNQAWMEVEKAVEQLGILETTILPPISHGICLSCSERMTTSGALS